MTKKNQNRQIFSARYVLMVLFLAHSPGFMLHNLTLECLFSLLPCRYNTFSCLSVGRCMSQQQRWFGNQLPSRGSYPAFHPQWMSQVSPAAGLSSSRSVAAAPCQQPRFPSAYPHAGNNFSQPQKRPIHEVSAANDPPRKRQMVEVHFFITQHG